MRINHNMATIEELEKRIMVLEKYIADRKVQQITSPLDLNSQSIIYAGIPRFTFKNTGTVTATKSIKVVIDGQSYEINVK